MKYGRMQIQAEKVENKTTNRAKMSNKRCVKARLQYLQRSYKASEATSRATCFALLQPFSWLTCLILPSDVFVSIIQFTFLQLILIIAQVLKQKWFDNDGFGHSQGTNKYVNEAVNEPPRLAGKKVKCRSLSEPIGLQDLEDSARSQAWNKINKEYFCIIILKFF